MHFEKYFATDLVYRELNDSDYNITLYIYCAQIILGCSVGFLKNILI